MGYYLSFLVSSDRPNIRGGEFLLKWVIMMTIYQYFIAIKPFFMLFTEI